MPDFRAKGNFLMPINNEKAVNITLDAAGGRCSVKSVAFDASGDVPTLPIPERRGYDFDGWYTKVSGGDKIDTGMSADSVTVSELYAHWSQNEKENSFREQRKKKNIRKKQQKAIIIMAVAVVLLAIALVVVNYLVDIYKYEDVDGSIYYIKKKDGVYALYDKDSLICDINSDGYYQTKVGTQLKINASTGEITDIIYVDDLNALHKDELFGASGRVLMFKQLTYDETSTLDKSKVIKSISVSNMNGEFTFERGKDNNFVIEGYENLAFDIEKFAQFSVACGKPLSLDVLKNPVLLSDGTIDLSEYGLSSESRVKTEIDEEGNEIQVEYTYSPAVYVITTMTGEWHRVIVGDSIVSEEGYYAIYDGGYVKDSNGNFTEVGRRQRVYILGADGISDGVLARIEDLITPMIVYPMGENEYFDVKDFNIYKNINHEKITEELYAIFGDKFDGMTDEEISALLDSDEEIYKAYFEIFEKYSEKICSFSYQDLAERQGSMYSYIPYVSHIEYSKGYYINSDNISSMLYNLCTMGFVEVTKLNPSDEDLQKYGLSDYGFYMEFFFHNAADDTEEEMSYIYNTITFSTKDKNGHYYAYSDMFDMIVCIDESYLDFFEWEEYKWYDQKYIQLDISNIQNIIIESPSVSASIVFDNSQSTNAGVLAQSGNKFTAKDGVEYNVVKDENGKYVLKKGNETLTGAYYGDYMVGGVVYTKGQKENDSYIFSETMTKDVNGDDTIDYVTYYLYNVLNVEGKYELIAQIISADTNGNQIGETQNVVGTVAMSCEYFTTNSGFLFYTSKMSALGQVLSTRYEKHGLGTWHSGGLYTTADDQMVIVDYNTGEWAKIKSVTNPVFFGDAAESSLIKGAVRTETTYDAAGNIAVPGDLYYATSGYDLRLNTETGKIEKYTTKTKTWSNATAEDCTVGVWAKGSYYVTDTREVVLVNEGSGDFFIMAMTTASSKAAEVFINGDKLSYEFDTVLSTGKASVKNEVDNFREFYKGLIYANLEGMADLTEEQMNAFMAMDDFSSGGKDNPCVLKITILGRDMYGNERNIVYRFYRYSERKAYITIEVLGSDGIVGSDPNNAYGSFYVLSSFTDKIVNDLVRLMNGQEITATSKY